MTELTKKMRELHKKAVGTHWVNDGIVQELANAVPALCDIIDRQAEEIKRLKNYITCERKNMDNYLPPHLVKANNSLAQEIKQLQAELEKQPEPTDIEQKLKAMNTISEQKRIIDRQAEELEKAILPKECQKECPGVSCPHWQGCYPELVSDFDQQDEKIKEQAEEIKRLNGFIKGIVQIIKETDGKA